MESNDSIHDTLDFCVIWDAIGYLWHHMGLADMTQTVKCNPESGTSNDPRFLYVNKWNKAEG